MISEEYARDRDLLNALNDADDALYQAWRRCPIGTPSMQAINDAQALIQRLIRDLRAKVAS